ncbi:hypothetical protein L1987_17861 [Smallanthus sonchifolius]|uniref:Uncharacterized protein n=1 Tax=Smallanthus sonchifolius TaxID=185202 RepID=A0ACB9J042_9ASTR|nr:hypothetical protein L1987_17861 [Smallanthus sonchifolius]
MDRWEFRCSRFSFFNFLIPVLVGFQSQQLSEHYEPCESVSPVSCGHLNFSLDDNSSESIKASCAFMESPSNQLYPSFPNSVQFTSQEALPNFFLGEATQSYDTFNPYQDSTTHDCFKYQIGLYASSLFESNDLLQPPMHQPEITQMPPSVLENHKKAKGRKKKTKNVESEGGVNMGWQGKATIRCRWSKFEDRFVFLMFRL